MNGVEFEPLSSKSKYTLEYQSNGLIRFEIHQVEQKDLGEYRCHAMNVHGYDNSLATLKFECKPPSLMSTLLVEAKQRAYKQLIKLIPELDPIAYAIAFVGLLLALLILFSIRWTPEFRCDRALESFREYIFRCTSDSCDYKN